MFCYKKNSFFRKYITVNLLLIFVNEYLICDNFELVIKIGKIFDMKGNPILK